MEVTVYKVLKGSGPRPQKLEPWHTKAMVHRVSCCATMDDQWGLPVSLEHEPNWQVGIYVSIGDEDREWVPISFCPWCGVQMTVVSVEEPIAQADAQEKKLEPVY